MELVYTALPGESLGWDEVCFGLFFFLIFEVLGVKHKILSFFYFYFFQPCTKKRVGESFLSSQLKLNLSGNLITLVESRKRLT